MRPVLAIVIASLAAGCTAAKGSLEVVQAERAVHRASERGAEAHALYQYTLAVRYLEKAREELGHNQFRTASELARTSAEHADQAIVELEGQGLGMPVEPGTSDPKDGLTTLGTATIPAPVLTDSATVQTGAPPDGVQVHDAPSGGPLPTASPGDPHEPIGVTDSATPKPAADTVKQVPAPAPRPEPAPEPKKDDDPWKDVPL